MWWAIRKNWNFSAQIFTEKLNYETTFSDFQLFACGLRYIPMRTIKDVLLIRGNMHWRYTELGDKLRRAVSMTAFKNWDINIFSVWILNKTIVESIDWKVRAISSCYCAYVVQGFELSPKLMKPLFSILKFSKPYSTFWQPRDFIKSQIQTRYNSMIYITSDTSQTLINFQTQIIMESQCPSLYMFVI